MKTGNEHGFTLIEVLAALTIFAVVGLAAFSLLSRAVAARTAVGKTTAQLAQTRQALDRLAEDLSGVRSFALEPFRANADSLAFISLVKLPDGRNALRRVTYVLRADVGAENLLFTRTVSDFHGNHEETLLLPAVRSWQWRYLRSIDPAVQWVDEWQAAAELPRAVCVQIHFASGREPVNRIYPIRAYEKTTAK